jgi:hypothetical protein
VKWPPACEEVSPGQRNDHCWKTLPNSAVKSVTENASANDSDSCSVVTSYLKGPMSQIINANPVYSHLTSDYMYIYMFAASSTVKYSVLTGVWRGTSKRITALEFPPNELRNLECILWNRRENVACWRQ